MRWILYLLISGLLLLAPVDRVDVAKLIPVEAVAVFEEDGRLVIVTDTEDRGEGATVEVALENLKENAVGIIYMDTLRYLLVGESMEAHTEEMIERLKSGVKTGRYAGGDVKEEARLLDAHSESAKPKAG